MHKHDKKHKVAKTIVEQVIDQTEGAPLSVYHVVMIARPKDLKHKYFCPYGLKAYRAAHEHGLNPLFISVGSPQKREEIKREMGVSSFPQVFFVKDGEELEYIGGSDDLVRILNEREQQFNSLRNPLK